MIIAWAIKTNWCRFFTKPAESSKVNVKLSWFKTKIVLHKGQVEHALRNKMSELFKNKTLIIANDWFKIILFNYIFSVIKDLQIR